MKFSVQIAVMWQVECSRPCEVMVLNSSHVMVDQVSRHAGALHVEPLFIITLCASSVHIPTWLL